MRWVACISQTGTELYNICEARLRKPDVLIVTDEQAVMPGIWDLEIPEVIVCERRPSEDILFQAFKGADLITLHGYLYILPKSICEAYAGKIINGHPGAIHLYPELKGKDPQLKAYNNRDKYEYFGVVLHEVITEVDAGRILDYDEIDAALVSDLTDLFSKLKNISINMWIRFLNNRESIYEASSNGSSGNWEDDAFEYS